jgi:hypothetical protein
MEKDLGADDAAVLASLLKRFGTVAAPTAVSSRRRRSASTYDRITHTAGLLVALALMAALWVTGGYFTLTWLSSIGVRLADVGLAPIDVLLRLSSTRPAAHWLWVLTAWLIPASLSAAEVGLWPRRVAHPLLWCIWVVFLGFDAGTTAAGVVLALPWDSVTSWIIGGVLGVTLALLPEKGVRIIWRLLREG